MFKYILFMKARYKWSNKYNEKEDRIKRDNREKDIKS